MEKDGTRTSHFFAAGVVVAWTVVAWWAVIFTAGWAGSVSDVLFNQNGDHLGATLAVWLIALSPSIGWWLLLRGRLKNI
jgi:hypothetical protein